MQTSYLDFFKRACIVVAVATIPILIWYLFGVILMVFGAILLAMLLRLGAQPFVRHASLPEGIALALSGLLILVIVGAPPISSARVFRVNFKT